MSRLYGTMKGDRPGVSTRGSHRAMSGHIHGWGVGGRVHIERGAGDADKVHLFATGGERGAMRDKLLASIDGPGESGARTVILYNPATGKELGTWIIY